MFFCLGNLNIQVAIVARLKGVLQKCSHGDSDVVVIVRVLDGGLK